MDATRREALLKEYSEVGNNFRLLTDIRFKLLGLLPIAAAAAAALKGDHLSGKGFVLSLFGLVATLGVAAYNERNDQLYDALVTRAASIERSLGLPDGYFANRPRAWLDVPLLGWSIDHRNGVTTIYAASIALWAFGVLAPTIQFVRTSGVLAPIVEFGRTWVAPTIEFVRTSEVLAPTLEFLRRVPFGLGLPGLAATVVVNIIALVLAIGLTVLALLIIWKHKDRREKKLRKCAAEAVKTATVIPVESVAECEKLLSLCEDLSGKTRKTIRSRAQFYTDAKSARHYLAFGSREVTAAHIVALLTDLPAGWLLDCATNRRGTLTAQTGRQPGLVDALAKNWWLLLLRGIAAIIFGGLAFARPATLVSFYGAYALADGVLAIIAAIIGGAWVSRWWLAIIGLLGIAAGLWTLLMPGRSALVPLFFIAGWAIATGVFQIIGAIQLRKEIYNERLLILGGVISVLFGIVMILTLDTGTLALVWAIGTYVWALGAGALSVIGTYVLALGAGAIWVVTYAVIIGVLLVALAFRLKKERSSLMWMRDHKAG